MQDKSVSGAERLVKELPSYATIAELTAACTIVQLLSTDSTALAHARRFKEAVANKQVV